MWRARAGGGGDVGGEGALVLSAPSARLESGLGILCVDSDHTAHLVGQMETVQALVLFDKSQAQVLGGHIIFSVLRWHLIIVVILSFVAVNDVSIQPAGGSGMSESLKPASACQHTVDVLADPLFCQLMAQRWVVVICVIMQGSCAAPSWKPESNPIE